MGGTTHFAYTDFDLLTARTGPDGIRQEFSYDTNLRLTRVTNPQGLTWDYAYDAAGRLVTETDFDGRALSYDYDPSGRLTSQVNGLGQRIDFTHNALGQVIRKEVEGNGVTTFEYDIFDELAVAAGPDAELERMRDRYGRLQSEKINGRTLTYRYDAVGRKVGRTTPSGAVSEWSYDAAGRRTKLTTSGRDIAFSFDALGREVGRTVSDFVALSSSFDEMNRVTTQDVTSGSRSLQHRAYTYGVGGGLVGISDALSGARGFDVDSAGRVTAVHAHGWTERYAYDDAGNQTEASWPTSHPSHSATGARTYDGTRIVGAGAVRYEHDGQGRVVLRQRTRLSRKPDTWRYEWDAEDRLTAVTTPDGTVWRYSYDPLGRRISKQSPSETVHFTWDGTTLCEQTTANVVLTWDHAGQRPVSQTERRTDTDDERFFAIVTDLIGTPTELVDESGELAWRTRATLWGTTTWNRDATAYTPFRFPGQYFDPESGLHYNYFRYYDPESARYLSQDPLGLAPAPNPTAYVHNPLLWADPLGLLPCKKNEPDDPTWGGRVVYGEPDAEGRPTAMHATLGPDMMGKNPTDPHGDPPGWQKDAGYNRAHLLGAQLGGSNWDPANFVTMHAYANSPVMRKIENQVRAAVEAGETIQYSVTPRYNGTDKIPTGVYIEAYGSNGFKFTQHWSTGITESGNTAFIPNQPKE